MNRSERETLLLGLLVLFFVDLLLGAVLAAVTYLLAGAFDLPARRPLAVFVGVVWAVYVAYDYVTTYRRTR